MHDPPADTTHPEPHPSPDTVPDATHPPHASAGNPPSTPPHTSESTTHQANPGQSGPPTTYHRPRYVNSLAENRPDTSPSGRITCHLGAYPVMRMPRDTGGIVVHSADFAPDGAFSGFTGTWDPFLPARSVAECTLALQLTAPRNTDDDHRRVDVRLWLTRNATWHRLGNWPGAGPGWPQLIAPFVHAASLPADDTEPAHSTRRDTSDPDAGR